MYTPTLEEACEAAEAARVQAEQKATKERDYFVSSISRGRAEPSARLKAALEARCERRRGGRLRRCGPARNGRTERDDALDPAHRVPHRHPPGRHHRREPRYLHLRRWRQCGEQAAALGYPQLSELNRVRSSRRLEAETHRNIEVIWLLRHLKPDFKTIADFRRDNRHAFRHVFRQLGPLV
jgi:hypothetical protein